MLFIQCRQNVTNLFVCIEFLNAKRLFRQFPIAKTYARKKREKKK